MSQVADARVDGMLTLRGCRAVDVAAAQLIVRESGGHVAFPACETELGRAAGSRAALARRRGAHACGARGAGRDRPRRGRVVIDAALAERLALLLAGGAGDMSAQPDWFGARVERAAERIVEVTGLRPAGTLPSPEWLDRGAWAAANLASTGSLLNPLLDRVGENLGMLGGPARAGRLLHRLGGARGAARDRRAPGARAVRARAARPVGPAAPAVRRPRTSTRSRLGMDVERDELADWVIFHEVTHAVQFGGVPWLRPHISALLRDLLGELELKVDAGTIAQDADRGRPEGARRMPSATAGCARGRRPGQARAARPRPGDHGARRGARRVDDGRRGGGGHPVAGQAARRARRPAPRPAPRRCACSTVCSGSR